MTRRCARLSSPSTRLITARLRAATGGARGPHQLPSQLPGESLADYMDRAARDAQDLLARTFGGHKLRAQFLHHLAFRLRRWGTFGVRSRARRGMACDDDDDETAGWRCVRWDRRLPGRAATRWKWTP